MLLTAPPHSPSFLVSSPSPLFMLRVYSPVSATAIRSPDPPSACLLVKHHSIKHTLSTTHTHSATHTHYTPQKRSPHSSVANNPTHCTHSLHTLSHTFSLDTHLTNSTHIFSLGCHVEWSLFELLIFFQCSVVGVFPPNTKRGQACPL